MDLESVTSIAALVVSVVSMFVSARISRKNSQRNLEFERYEEAIRQLERKSSEHYMQLNSLSGVVPYFYFALDHSGIEIRVEGSKKFVEFYVSLINLGKEAAVQMRLVGDDSYSYFETEGRKGSGYIITSYLNEGYAKPEEIVTFAARGEILEGEKIAESVGFRIEFQDLLGNLYMQKFKFMHDGSVISRNIVSDVPVLIEEKAVV